MSRAPENPHDLHWGESDLNVPERMGGTRNESAIEAFIEYVEATSHTFFIQTCGHTARYKNSRGEWVAGACPEGIDENCREMTAIFFGQPSDVVLDEEKLKDMRVIANRLKLPLFVIHHHPYDYDFEFPVRIDRYVKGRRVQHAGSDWDAVSDTLRAEQFHHEASEATTTHRGNHGHPECGSRSVDWLSVPEARSKREGIDLTVSRIIREIPGVRHIDIDAAVICPECGNPFCMIEGTSDGLGAREAKAKASFMTRKIADAFSAKTMLIHHLPNDADLESEVRAKTFRKGKNEPERDEVGDWDVAASQFDRIQDYHLTQICRGAYRR